MDNLFLDIETIPTQNSELETEIRANVKPPGSMKKKETIDKWRAEKGEAAAEEAYRKTALDGSRGEILSVAWAFNSDDICCNYRDTTTTETDLLTAFSRSVTEKMISHNIGFFARVIHGSKSLFDLRFLFQRSVILGVYPPFDFCQDHRANGEHVFDTMTAWAGWGNYCSLDSLCATLGIESPKGKMTGADVWDYFKSGRIDEIVEYNKKDVEALRVVYKKLTFINWGGV